MQQMDKDVEDAQVERNSRHYIVALATINDAAGIEKDKTGHQ